MKFSFLKGSERDCPHNASSIGIIAWSQASPGQALHGPAQELAAEQLPKLQSQNHAQRRYFYPRQLANESTDRYSHHQAVSTYPECLQRVIHSLEL